MVSLHGPADDEEREKTIHPMEKIIKRHRLPNTDSVQELAGFWDKHDLTDFADELQEVREPVFVRAGGANSQARRTCASRPRFRASAWRL